MNTEDEVFALLAIAKEQQKTIDTAIVKMTTMAEEITAENQKLFNKNIEEQKKIHSHVIRNAKAMLTRKIWIKDLVYWLVGLLIFAVLITGSMITYEVYLGNRIATLQIEKNTYQTNVNRLVKDGGKIVFGNCGKQTCVRVKNENYWSSDNGKIHWAIVS